MVVGLVYALLLLATDCWLFGVFGRNVVVTLAGLFRFASGFVGLVCLFVVSA